MGTLMLSRLPQLPLSTLPQLSPATLLPQLSLLSTELKITSEDWLCCVIFETTSRHGNYFTKNICRVPMGLTICTCTTIYKILFMIHSFQKSSYPYIQPEVS